MAVKKGQSEKASKVNTATEVDNDELDELEEVATATAQVEEVSPAPEVAQSDESEFMTVAMFQTIDPAPTIGHPSHGGYSFQANGIMVLKERQNYTVPFNVGMVLLDKKVAGRVG
jgi:hypothetical protein